ncbi:hypothetical protein R4Y59_002673 [Enterococcus faecalis]|nr:hypothetical protein [Enterococcus faecalis]
MGRNYSEQEGIRIRGVKEETVIGIDRKAKELGEKLNRPISRNEYMKMLLEGENSRTMYELQKKLLEETIDRFTRVMEIQIDTFERYIERNEMMMELMTGIPVEDLGKGVEHDS